MSTWLPICPSSPEFSGPYELVEVDIPVSINTGNQALQTERGPDRRVWFNRATDDVVHEDLCENRSFAAIVSDFDGVIVDSEGPYGYFAVSWRALFREAGIQGSDEELEALRKLVYGWRNDLNTSVSLMIERIISGRSKDGGALTEIEKEKLRQLIDVSVLYKWSEFMDWLIAGDSLGENVVRIIADRKEQIGKAILEEDPARVLTLAPILPGVKDFFEALPPDVIVALASASRVETTIRPILEAHAKVGNEWLLARFNGLIFGEGDYCGYSKPHRRFYEYATLRVGTALYDRGMLPPGGLTVSDMLYIGDVIARTKVGDLPMTRKGMHHIVFQRGKDTNAFGPRAAVVSDFLALLDVAGSRNIIDNITLRRLALTLQIR
ncbi:hypothetical protein KKB64_04960 [Patescibacteria group bacterium]|nr:hypothetical protein [Patescibacteria group bacterium]MBU1473101.1 hypothetical protein [Patescibacteria group bacterium]MBU2459637.1 hypothetical protein [Patescibacteria group bacterium]MBU2544460.1 hypothetical protein [Patescibacteria group bacterium]